MRTITILLIEDNSLDVRLIREILKNMSNFKSNLLSVGTLKEGCEQIQKNNFDIILLDLNLPDSTGRQTFQKAIDCSKEIPIILITSIEDEKLSLELISEGAQDYITKQSLNPDLLVKSILYSIERQALLRNIKIQNVQIDRIEKERILIAKFHSQNPGPVLRIAINGKLLYINEACIKLFPIGQLIINEIIPSKLKDIIDPIFIEGTNIEFELCHREFIYSFYAVPLIEDGYINLYGQDITERKRTEEVLLQSEENFRRSISDSPLGIRIVSVDGKTIYANKAFLDIYKINSVEELTSISAINRHTPESYAQHQERKEKRENGHDVFDYETSIICKNAEIRHVKVSRKEVLWNRIKHYQVINIDITEQKKLTIDLIEAKEHAEQSDRLKSAFLANMSHEIRTPMNGILGFADLLKEPNLTGEEQQEYIEIIEKSGARMLNIINDIVDISKIESGQMKVSISETNVNEQIEYIYTFFKPEVESKGIRFSFKNSLPLKEALIKTDREKVYAILTNLVKNAIKFTNAGSIEFGCMKKGKYLESFVKDTGIGIPKDRQEAIFDRFVQADIGNKRSFQGAGLGLSISKAYVEMLGGKIWVESEEGKGSTFYFALPHHTEPKEENVSKNEVLTPVEEIQLKKLKILIAEDDKSSEKFIAIAVRKFGKEIINVRTGTEAVEACRNHPDIDLVLMDIQMPDMDGYEATRQIRQFNKDVVIIAQTAFALTGDREDAMDAGCNDYMSKPIRKDKLMEVMQRYFQ